MSTERRVIEKPYEALYDRKPASPPLSWREHFYALPFYLSRIVFFPLVFPLACLVTRALTHHSEPHRLPSNKAVEKSANITGGAWKYIEIDTSIKEGRWRYAEIDLSEAKKKIFVESIQINAFKKKSSNQALHINVHGALGGSENAFDDFAPAMFALSGADQWNVHRCTSWTIASPKKQLRQVIAMAIQQGYKEIRLDGISYGAGLVRRVYHELVQDKAWLEHFKENGVTLHYTARNGYRSEALTLGALLTEYYIGKDGNYISGQAPTPKPNFFMKWLDNLSLFIVPPSLSLRTQRIQGRYAIPENSRNYVISYVTSLSKDEPEVLKRDPAIGFHERGNNIDKYGHVCLEKVFTFKEEENPQKRHNIPICEEGWKVSHAQMEDREGSRVLTDDTMQRILEKFSAQVNGEIKQKTDAKKTLSFAEEKQQKILAEWKEKKRETRHTYFKMRKYFNEAFEKQALSEILPDEKKAKVDQEFYNPPSL